MYLGNVLLKHRHFIEKLAINHNDTLWLRCLGIGAQRNEGYSDGCFCSIVCIFIL